MTPTENDGTPQAPPPPRLVVPAYIHPAVHPGDWEWLGEHAERVRLVILNIHNGPGSGPEAPFKKSQNAFARPGFRSSATWTPTTATVPLRRSWPNRLLSGLV